MTTIAIVGAVPGLGLSTARRFGREGFNVALLARNMENTQSLCDALAADGIAEREYVADVRERPALRAALEQAGSDG